MKTATVEVRVTSASFPEYIQELKLRFNPQKWVILIQTPTFGFNNFELEAAQRKGYYAYPPKGLQCLKAVGSMLGVRVDILDLNFRLLERLQHTSAPVNLHNLVDDIVGSYLAERPGCSIAGVGAGVTVPNVFSYQGHPYVHVLKNLINKGYLVLAGGSVATLERKNLLKLGLAHMVFKGETEYKFRYFLETLFGMENPQPTQGIFYQPNGELLETAGPPDAPAPKFDLIPTYDEIPVERYCTIGHVGPFLRMLDPDRAYGTLQLVRGCRAHCSFCELAQFRGRGFNHYKPEEVVDELIYLANERGVRHFEWVDDDLLANKKAAMEVFQSIIDSGLKITWSANVGLIAASLNREMLRLMSDSGCIGFRIGIETGSEEILRKTHKPATMRKFMELTEIIPEFPELFIVGCFMLGFENETYRQIYSTIKLAIRMKVAWCSIAVLQITQESTVDSEFEIGLHENVSDYMPSAFKKKTEDEIVKTLGPKELFGFPHDEVHSPEVLTEMWFAFNTIVNYVNNKNLKAGGNPGAFVGWVEGLYQSYPHHPLMDLFLYLGYTVKGDREKALKHYEPPKTSYWKKRFEQYGLNRIIENPPQTALEVQNVLEELMKGYELERI